VGAVYTNPGDLSSTTDHFQTFNGADTNDATIGVGLKTNWVSGAFDPAAFGGGTGSGSWAAVTMALRPAPAPQDLTPSLFTNTNTFHAPTVERFAPTGLAIVNNNGTTVTHLGDSVYSIEKTGGTGSAYDAGAVSSSGVSGPFVLRLKHLTNGSPTNAWFGGVNNDPTTDDSHVMDYSWVYKDGSGFWDIYEGGASQAANVGNDEYAWMWRTGTTLGYGRGASFNAALNSPDRTQTTSATLYFDSSLYGANVKIQALFYVPQVLEPALFTNSSSFFAPTVQQFDPGQNLLPDLFTNSQSFYGPTITTGAVTLTPSLVTNTNTFYSPTIGLFLTPSLFTNTNTFYAATVTSNYTLAPSLLTDGDNFFSPTVAPGEYRMLPDLFTNSQTFYAPEVVAGPVDLTATLFVNKVGDSGSGSQFFSHYIERVPFNPWAASTQFKRGIPRG
jgi:hypothetical protein